MEALIKSCSICCVWLCPVMPNILQNNILVISLKTVKLFCLFVAFSYTYMEATVLSCCYSWLWSGMPKVL